jgi:hypothetical protein
VQNLRAIDFPDKRNLAPLRHLLMLATMRPWMAIFLAIPALALMAASPPPQPALEWYPRNVSKLERITPVSLKMSPMVAMACAPAVSSIVSNHGDKYFDVYISDSGASTIKSGNGTYPEGTTILKRKYSDAAGTVVELYTGMVKRAKGYNPTGGDWEYFTSTADGKITEHGALASCMGCHQAYQNFDYVTRTYFTQPQSYSASGAASPIKN